MDKLSVMNAFCRIVERGSFARAAEDLGVSPALLSREVKLLEQSLSATLLTRTTRSMSLTDHGQIYYREAQTILDAVGQVEDRIREGAGTVRGHLNAVIDMVEDEKYCPDIMKQVSALQSSLEKVNRVLLQNHLETCVTEGLQGGQREQHYEELMDLIYKLSK